MRVLTKRSEDCWPRTALRPTRTGVCLEEKQPSAIRMHGAADHKLWHSSVPRGEVPLRVLALQGLLSTPYRGRWPQGVWNLTLRRGGGAVGGWTISWRLSAVWPRGIGSVLPSFWGASRAPLEHRCCQCLSVFILSITNNKKCMRERQPRLCGHIFAPPHCFMGWLPPAHSFTPS